MLRVEIEITAMDVNTVLPAYSYLQYEKRKLQNTLQLTFNQV